MVLAAARPGEAEPAVVVPDPGAWALWGIDLTASGLVPAEGPHAASALVLPETVPEPLVAAVREAWARLPPTRRLVTLPGPGLPGIPAAEVLFEPGDGSRGDGEAQAHHHDEGAPMEITGDPSRDGLVMEAIEVRVGPLAPGLPGGLAIDLELDGDVVARCEPRATLRASRGSRPSGAVPDPLARAAWTAAMERARGGPWTPAVLAAVERERALSHTTWLSGLGVVLGWRELAERAWAAAKPLIGAGRRDLASAVRAAAPGLAALCSLLDGSRRLRRRTGGLAVVPRAEAPAGGPVARASGVAADARAEDPVYAELGFELRTGDGGDAEARVLQRAYEALDAVVLARAALEAPAGGPRAQAAVAEVESPRGPVRVEPGAREGASLRLRAPGAAALRELAGRSAVGLELGSALAAVASFDLSPWEAPE